MKEKLLTLAVALLAATGAWAQTNTRLPTPQRKQ